MIYGRSATGKTTLISTFPKPLLLVDVNDRGTDSISDVKDIDVMEPSTWDELDELYWFLKDNPGKYRTVAIDTVSQVQQMLLEEVAGAKAQKSGKQVGDWGVMTKAQWGEVSSRLKTWITNMRDLDVEVVFIAQDRTFNVDEEDEAGVLDPEVGPRLMPSVNAHLCAAVHVIGHTFIGENVRQVKKGGKTIEKRTKEYCIRLGPNPYYITKIRKPRDVELPEFLEDPTYSSILEIITGE